MHSVSSFFYPVEYKFIIISLDLTRLPFECDNLCTYVECCDVVKPVVVCANSSNLQCFWMLCFYVMLCIHFISASCC